MYVENSTTMNNGSLIINQTVQGQFGTIPKRVPVDNLQWMESNQMGQTMLTPDEQARFYAEKDFNFYLVLTLLTLGFVCGILCLYICFCLWAMRGELDLPLPGGGTRKTNTLRFVNPLKNNSVLNYIRQKIYGLYGQTYPTTTNSMNPPEGTQHQACRSKAEQKIPTISHEQPTVDIKNVTAAEASFSNQQDFNELAVNQRRSSLGHKTSKMFESKALDLQDSFKQSKQFKYDHQMDDEPEQVVFDVFDLKREHY